MLDDALAFLCEADRLKSVHRASVLMDLSRPENSAEHSWHVALWAMVMGASDRAIAMILIHDLVEIDVGDVPLHSAGGQAHGSDAVRAAEAAAARRIGDRHPHRSGGVRCGGACRLSPARRPDAAHRSGGTAGAAGA